MKVHAAYNASSQSQTQLYFSGIVPFCSAYIHYFVRMNGLAFAVYKKIRSLFHNPRNSKSLSQVLALLYCCGLYDMFRMCNYFTVKCY